MNEKDPSELAKQVKLAQAGDKAAFSALIQATQNRLFRFCVYLAGDRSLAQDLCQDTYIRALEKIRKLKEPERFTSWLLKTAKNLYLDHVKSPRNSAANLPIEEVTDSDVFAVSSDGPEVYLQIQAGMAGMKPEDKAILLLVDLEGHSYLEAAHIVGISESNLRFRLHHIRKNFAVRFNK